MKEKKKQSENLKRKTISSSGWGFLDKGLGFIVQFIIGIVLARLLPPVDFGLLGLGMIVVGFGQTFVQLGLGPSLIQKQDITERHVRVVLTTSGIAGILLTVIVYFAAPLAAWILNNDEVIPIIKALSVIFVIAGFQIPSRALLKKKLDFKHIFFVSIVKSVLYGVITITLALIGFGVWSLVIGSIVQRFISFIGSYAFVRHSFKPLFARQEIKDLVYFGSGMTLSGLFNYLAKQGDYFMIGRILGADALGLYTKAYGLMVQPTKQFVSVLSNVLFPATSKIQDDVERLQKVFLKTIRTIGFVTIPLCFLLIILSPELIVGLYGEKWSGTIVPLQILAAFGMFRALYNAAAAFLRAKGWVYSILFSQLVYGGTVLFFVWIGANYYGLAGASIGVGISILLIWGLMMELNCRAIKIKRSLVLKTIVPGLIIGIMMGIPLYFVRYYLTSYISTDLILLSVLSVIGIIFLLISILLVPQKLLSHIPAEIILTIRDFLPETAQKKCNKLLPLLR